MEVFALLAFALIAYAIIKSLAQWQRNNELPVLTVPATISDKRKRNDTTMMSTGPDGAMTPMTNVVFYLKFRLGDGQELEFHVRHDKYREVEIGDGGVLTYQGTRFLGFEQH